MAEVPEQSSSCRFARRRSERPRTRRSCITAAQKLTPNQTPSRLEDPHEYVRRGYDLLEDLQSPRTAAVNLLIDVVEKVGDVSGVRAWAEARGFNPVTRNGAEAKRRPGP